MLVGDVMVAAFNAQLRAANLPPLRMTEADADAQGRGGRAAALFRGLVGTRFYGDLGVLEETGEKD